MRRKHRNKPEPTIALINVVFLMLVFFLVAGTIAQPLDGDLTLVNTADLDTTSPPDALVIGPEGIMIYRGNAVTDLAQYFERTDRQPDAPVRIVPDRNLSARKLIAIGTRLQNAGAASVIIVTQRGQE